MFDCKGCKALKAENEYLRGLVDRLLDKSVGPAMPADQSEDEQAPPPPVEVIRDDEGRVIEERHNYGV